jgi:hypothetical protein
MTTPMSHAHNWLNISIALIDPGRWGSRFSDLFRVLGVRGVITGMGETLTFNLNKVKHNDLLRALVQGRLRKE